MEHYVTLFDSLFLPQGLALHASLQGHAGPFTLWVLCMDAKAKDLLDSLGLPTVRTMALAEIETEELLAVKPGRTRAEYCWTLTPFTPKAVFDRAPEIERVTYLDADIFLLKSPSAIFKEFEASGKAVMITDHAYDAEYDQSAYSGQYCVQFVIFRRTVSELVRTWWQDRCLEWCFAKSENGKFGDQKYLDDWPERFGAYVHVLKQIDVLLAPWNARRFPYSRAIAWHFHGLRILSRNRVLLHGGYAVPNIVDDAIYAPYVSQLKKNIELLGAPVVQTAMGSRLISALVFLLKSLGKSLCRVPGRDVIRKMR